NRRLIAEDREQIFACRCSIRAESIKHNVRLRRLDVEERCLPNGERILTSRYKDGEPIGEISQLNIKISGVALYTRKPAHFRIGFGEARFSVVRTNDVFD